ncbi:hypothetical protein [Salicibibacter cibarius]|uniref:hypothetical protein n=1 Tax=Salicibibacter cibarius TaxID=2743000 RepID=UPI001FE9609C|nr:hypothetical protein [Salicibibacter cibarius]
MAMIPQTSLFSWKDLENLGDLECLRLVLDYLPDEALMRTLEKERYKGAMTCSRGLEFDAGRGCL